MYSDLDSLSDFIQPANTNIYAKRCVRGGVLVTRRKPGTLGKKAEGVSDIL
jgi:hypothetical protein